MGDLRQEPYPLIVGAVDHHRRADQICADGHISGGRTEVGRLLLVDHLLDVGTALAAVLPGPREGQPPFLGKLRGQLADQGPVVLDEVTVRVHSPPIFAEVLNQELADLGAKGLLFLSKAEVHDFDSEQGRLHQALSADLVKGLLHRRDGVVDVLLGVGRRHHEPGTPLYAPVQ